MSALTPTETAQSAWWRTLPQWGWLLLPETHDLDIYRPDTEPEDLQAPDQISGEPIAPGFVLTLADIGDPGF